MRKNFFVGRDESLNKLKRLCDKKSASLVVIRGRRRIGKSRLIEEFAKGHKFYSISGLAPTEKTTPAMQREEFVRQLQEQMDLPPLKADDWGDLFTELAKKTQKGQVIVLLDEISWMGSKDPTFLGKLKIAWDKHFSKNPQLILILCGSVSSWIEKNIISSTGFFGRISLKIHLNELSLKECYEVFSKIGYRGSIHEKLMLLSITGGIPWYLQLINPKLSANENIKHLCFEEDGILFDEFKHIFHDLFGKRSKLYQQIVRQLVNGPLSYQELAKKLDYSPSGPLSEYLDELVSSNYVDKNYTWSLATGNESRLFKYRLEDNYLRFYLKYIEPNRNKVIKGHFTNKSLAALSAWDVIMGFQFENLVLRNRNLIHQRLKIDPADITYDNPFFQRKTTKQPGCQIDYLIQTRYGNLYVCEIKFSRSPIGPKVIEDVREKIANIQTPKGFACIPVLIHANGCLDSVTESDFFACHIDFRDVLQ